MVIFSHVLSFTSRPESLTAIDLAIQYIGVCMLSLTRSPGNEEGGRKEEGRRRKRRGEGKERKGKSGGGGRGKERMRGRRGEERGGRSMRFNIINFIHHFA